MLKLLRCYMFSGVSFFFCLHFFGHATLIVISSLSSNPSCFYIHVFPNLYPLWLQTNFVCIWYRTSHCSLFFSSVQFPLASLFTLCSFFPFLSLFCMGVFLLPLFFQLDFPVGGLQASFRNIIGTSCSVIFHWK